jgi:CubicO group peptidase (beta-lactamase class C family)
LRLDFTEDELVNKIEALPIEFKPGEKWDYRNTNYALLGVMIHRVTGKHYADFLQERIFRPWDMRATRLISETDIIPNRSSGYGMSGGKLQNQEWSHPRSIQRRMARSISMCWIWRNGTKRCMEPAC